MSESPSPESRSERLARRWFDLVREGDFDGACEALHDDVVVISRVKQGQVIEGREAVTAFIRETIVESLYEATPDTYVPVDDDRVIVEGRMRWIDDERVIRDDPVLWALEFRDELLVRFVPARTAVEAETLLSASRKDQ